MGDADNASTLAPLLLFFGCDSPDLDVVTA